eukprot:gene17182-18911_t
MTSMNDVLFIFGDDMDAILDVIESDQNVQDSFQEASDSVRSGIFVCQMCQKEYKRKGSLTQHIKRIHKVNDSTAEPDDQLSAELVVELLKEVKAKVCKNGCFSKEIKSELSNYAVSQPNTDLQKELEKLYNAYTNGLDREEFYGQFYANIVAKAKEYSQGLVETVQLY